MALPTIINKFGTLQGWNNVTVNLLGRDLEGITQLAYSDKTTKENVRGAGAYPIGRSRGNYEATASITLLKEEVDALQLSIGPGKRIQDIAPFDIPVIYELESGMIRTDILHNCEFTDKSIDVKQGDGTIAVQLPLIISHITWV
ncbi:hypothetical protein MYRA21_0075 [Myroides sp. A21]|uniref:hypothetical protein n=1 Tax=Myroides sp. A21 TaxID=1583100 RepID=UPI00057E27CF|nr:hypothetical protein [Myroides sp. A21]AJA67319.1 hypothetical protein MYRA21_0075 [Myroides sp. A21]